jgi:F420H(2)-dependent quinone reductase
VTWCKSQVALYEATDGRERGTLDGRPIVILTTNGAKSGSVRKNPVMRIKDGDAYVVVASNGGGARNPAWSRNVTTNPEVLEPVRREDRCVRRAD